MQLMLNGMERVDKRYVFSSLSFEKKCNSSEEQLVSKLLSEQPQAVPQIRFTERQSLAFPYSQGSDLVHVFDQACDVIANYEQDDPQSMMFGISITKPGVFKARCTHAAPYNGRPKSITAKMDASLNKNAAYMAAVELGYVSPAAIAGAGAGAGAGSHLYPHQSRQRAHDVMLDFSTLAEDVQYQLFKQLCDANVKASVKFDTSLAERLTLAELFKMQQMQNKHLFAHEAMYRAHIEPAIDLFRVELELALNLDRISAGAGAGPGPGAGAGAGAGDAAVGYTLQARYRYEEAAGGGVELNLHAGNMALLSAHIQRSDVKINRMHNNDGIPCLYASFAANLAGGVLRCNAKGFDIPVAALPEHALVIKSFVENMRRRGAGFSLNFSNEAGASMTAEQLHSLRQLFEELDGCSCTLPDLKLKAHSPEYLQMISDDIEALCDNSRCLNAEHKREHADLLVAYADEHVVDAAAMPVLMRIQPKSLSLAGGTRVALREDQFNPAVLRNLTGLSLGQVASEANPTPQLCRLSIEEGNVGLLTQCASLKALQLNVSDISLAAAQKIADKKKREVFDEVSGRFIETEGIQINGLKLGELQSNNDGCDVDGATIYGGIPVPFNDKSMQTDGSVQVLDAELADASLYSADIQQQRALLQFRQASRCVERVAQQFELPLTCRRSKSVAGLFQSSGRHYDINLDRSMLADIIAACRSDVHMPESVGDAQIAGLVQAYVAARWLKEFASKMADHVDSEWLLPSSGASFNDADFALIQDELRKRTVGDGAKLLRTQRFYAAKCSGGGAAANAGYQELDEAQRMSDKARLGAASYLLEGGLAFMQQLQAYAECGQFSNVNLSTGSCLVQVMASAQGSAEVDDEAKVEMGRRP